MPHEINCANQIVVTGWFPRHRRTSAVSPDSPSRRISFRVQRFWKDEITRELLSAGFWIELILDRDYEWIDDAFKTPGPLGATVEGKLVYSRQPPDFKFEKALIVVESLQFTRRENCEDQGYLKLIAETLEHAPDEHSKE